MSDHESYKREAAERALAYVASGMVLGLGTGSTVRYLLMGLAERLRDGRLCDVCGVPTSEQTAALARQLGIALTTLDVHLRLDLAIDGADEVDPALDLIKGLGGALLHEKIVATAARRLIVIADETKRVARLGTGVPLPVEVCAFGVALCREQLIALGAFPVLRCATDGSPFRTDEGNVILDCRFAALDDPVGLGGAMKAIPGVVEHGLFLGMTELAIFAGASGVTVVTR